MTTSTGPLGVYQKHLESGKFLPDEAQLNAVHHLDQLWQDLVSQPQPGFLAKLLGKSPAQIQGLYLWGSVGRGKTWLMDLFFESLPFAHKHRVHFHRFMARIHAALKVREAASDPLRAIAADWAQKYRVLCFDEFFVSDIADAMLLAGLLEALMEKGVVLVATSNAHPDDLYLGGLQRARFLPAIELLKRHCRVIQFAGNTDFRLRLLEQSEIYHHPLDAQAEQSLASSFENLSAGCNLERTLEFNGRPFHARQRGDGIIWFDFNELCEKPRSSHDYIEISRSFNTVFISGLPALDGSANDAARRFIDLVDEFYDRNVKLLISAATPIDRIYTGERLQFEFRRTASRLHEMQSHDYLARPHLP